MVPPRLSFCVLEILGGCALLIAHKRWHLAFLNLLLRDNPPARERALREQLSSWDASLGIGLLIIGVWSLILHFRQ
jgi:hypothetical protein